MLFFLPLVFALCATGLAQIETSRTEIGELNPFVIELEAFSCKRLFSREGTSAQTPIGCGSDADNNGDFGRLLPVKNLDDLNQIGNVDRAVVIPQSVLADKPLFEAIAENNRIKVLLVEFADEVTPLLPGVVSKFNPDGTGLVETFFSQPISLLSESDTAIIRERIEENNERGFDNLFWNHGAVSEFFNGPSDVSTEFCLSEDRCLPVGGQSVWGVVGRDPSPGLETVVVAVKLDSNGLFHDQTFAARDVAGSLTVLLGIADAISPFLEDIGQLEKQIIFAAFQGESFDAVGSKRFVFDIENSCQNGTENFDAEGNECLDESFLFFTEFNLLDVADISTVIVLDNLLTYEANNDIFIHTTDSLGIATIILETAIEGSSVIDQVEIDELPGTIIKSFADLGQFDGESIVLTAYADDIAEANPFVFSRFDRAPENSVSSAFVTSLVTDLSQAIILIAAGAEDNTTFVDSIAGSEDIISQLQGCLTQNFACELVATALGRSTDFVASRIQSFFATNLAPEQPSPPIFFPGVHERNEIASNTLPSGPEVFTRNFLTEKLSFGVEEILVDESNAEDLSCDVTNQCLDLVTGNAGNLSLAGICSPRRTTSVACVRRKCVCSSVFFHDAVSPLIDSQGNIRAVIPEILQNERVITEPFFELPRLTLFQHSRGVTEGIFFSFGIVFTILSYIFITCVLRKTSDTKLKLL